MEGKRRITEDERRQKLERFVEQAKKYGAELAGKFQSFAEAFDERRSSSSITSAGFESYKRELLCSLNNADDRRRLARLMNSLVTIYEAQYVAEEIVDAGRQQPSCLSRSEFDHISTPGRAIIDQRCGIPPLTRKKTR